MRPSVQNALHSCSNAVTYILQEHCKGLSAVTIVYQWERINKTYVIKLFLKTVGQSIKLVRSIVTWVSEHSARYVSHKESLPVPTDSPKYCYALIRYRDESLSPIGMHISCHGNYNLDTERVTGSVDNSQSSGDKDWK